MSSSNNNSSNSGSGNINSNDKPNKEGDNQSKKRKVWARTVNVSSGGGPPQAMSPEAAAKYIQQATANRVGIGASGGGREVKISFGPSRPPTASGSVNYGNLDLNALKETAAAAAAAQRPKGGGVAARKGKDGLPCSEAEMKALMSMFVEIMGMSMDSEKMKKPQMNNTATTNSKKKGPVFMFGNSNTAPPGWPDQEAMAAATAGFFADGASWEALRRTYGAAAEDEDEDDDDDDEEEEEEDDSIPDLDDMREMFGKPPAKSSQTEKGDIASGTWESSLEQVDIDDDGLETDELARKSSKKREKKNRKKLKQKEEAAQKAAEAAQKKREKAILSWRSRVVSACQSNELVKLDALIQESPIRRQNSSEEEKWSRSSIVPHLEFLLPNSYAKNRSHIDRGKEARYRLAAYILSTELPVAFTPLRSGRTALHIACFHGDLPFVELVLKYLAEYEDENSPLPPSCLNMTCNDSGWAPLHYAAVSGSVEMLELLLAGGCDVATITDDTHTWRESDGGGITPRELVQYIHDGNYDEVLESHGVALQEMENSFFGNQSDRRTFLRTLDKVLQRLKDVESNGYSPPDLERSHSIVESEVSAEDATPAEYAVSKKRKKKKKKKLAQKDTESTKDSAASVTSTQSSQLGESEQKEEDPLVSALLGMGFSKEQILAAVKACGGTNRATADDLVTWILGQDADGEQVNPEEVPSLSQQPRQEEIEVNEATVVKTRVIDESKRAQAEEKQKEEAARRLAAKREEQRRRNREWNNREQARQQQQAKAKITSSMNATRPQQTTPPGYAAAFPNLQSSIPPGLQTGLPNGLHSGLNMGNGATLQTGLLAPQPMPSSQPLPVTSNSTLPPMLNVGSHPSNAFPSRNIGSEYNTLSRTGNSVSPAAPVFVGHNSFPPIGDDDKTVSSFGSNRGLSVSSAPFVPSVLAAAPMPPSVPGVPPPGFMPPSSGLGPKPPSMNQSRGVLPIEERSSKGIATEPKQHSEIRATAKAFVPKRFTSAPAPSQPVTRASLPPLSGCFATSQVSQLNAVLPDGNVMESFNSGSAFPTGFLGTGGLPSATTSSLLGSSLQHSYENVPSVTPVSDDSFLAPSAGSSLTGLPGIEEPSLGLQLGFGTESQGVGTASLLTAAFTNAPPPGASSIWGGSQGVPSLSGLPPISFGDDGREANGVRSEQNVTWGAGGGSSLTGGQGSIW